MLFSIRAAKPARLVVLAYDISCQRRARRVRRMLDSLYHAKQYSVYEALLGQGEFRGLLAELSLCCDFSTDRLGAWWPVDGVRLCWDRGRLLVDAREGEHSGEVAALPSNIGNFVVCYDISDPRALNAVAAEVATEGVMVQRSVYWLRLPVRRFSALLARCSPYLDDGDCLWAYPLRGCKELWHIGPQAISVLPITTHRWRSS